MNRKPERMCDSLRLLRSNPAGVDFQEISEALPVRKAVGGREDPAGRYQASSAAERPLLRPTLPKYGSYPWVGFHSCSCPPNNLHLPSGTLATCGYWKTSLPWCH